MKKCIFSFDQLNNFAHFGNFKFNQERIQIFNYRFDGCSLMQKEGLCKFSTHFLGLSIS